MIKRTIPLFLILLCVVTRSTAFAEEAKPLTLADCYALSLKQSETIAQRQELITETEGRLLRSFGAIMPEVTFSAEETRQDGTGNSSFTLKEVPLRKFVFKQTLFGGFKELAAVAATKAERKQYRYEKSRAEQLLFSDVSDGFYLLLEYRKDLEVLESTRKILADRIDELKERERLGRSRPSEGVSVEAQRARLEAEWEKVRNEEKIVKQLLEFLTGLSDIGTITDTQEAVSIPPSRDYFLAKSEARPDVQAAIEAWHSAQKKVTIAEADFWPTVDVEGNYYTKRVGVAEGVNWDAALTVEVPVFRGTRTFGAVKEAKAKSRSAKLEFEKKKRIASREILDAYARFESARLKEKALEKALKASEEDYRLQAEDYRLNLVSNLDVLQSLKALQDARRDSIHALYDTQRLYWQLRTAAGETL